MNLNPEIARIRFFTDIHGSNTCFRKFLNLSKESTEANAKSVQPNVLVIGADITGKQIIPIVEVNNNLFSVKIGGTAEKVRKLDLPDLEKRLADVGYYPYVCNETEYKSLLCNDWKKREIFDKLAKERLEEWVKLANERLPPSEVCQVIINAGNDDPFFVDKILAKCPKLVRPEGKLIDLPGNIKLLSTGYSTKTPWNCPRDITEEELAKKIDRMTSKLKPGARVIFNFHCPPYNTALDLANEIDPVTFKPVAGNNKVPVGSTAVKKAIEVWQPLVSLHGHIHEVHAKQLIGKTLCYNPGTDYKNGKLQGVFLQINDGKVEIESLTQERYSAERETSNHKIVNKIMTMVPGFGKVLEENEIEKKLDALQKQVSEISEKQEKK
jgi:Icc-related predicted phosphoesterase